jgi:hypothetical protein
LQLIRFDLCAFCAFEAIGLAADASLLARVAHFALGVYPGSKKSLSQRINLP